MSLFPYIKRISKHSLNYSFAQILTNAISFFLVPVYTRFLVPSDYGIIATVRSITGALSTIYIMGQLSSWQRFYYDYRDNTKELKEYLGTIIVFIFGFTLFYTFAEIMILI
jgi:O-antigen/teichoic acid export membrane protein